MAPPSHSTFSKDEKVLCFHHDLLYEAKVLESKLVDPNDRKGAHQYKIHYKGWKSSWDDWVPQDRLRRFTAENKELAASLKKEMDEALRAKNASNKKRKSAIGDAGEGAEAGSSSAANTTTKASKKAKEAEVESEADYDPADDPAYCVAVPDRLKSILVDDWENVTSLHQLAPVPSATPVTQILQDYEAWASPRRAPGSSEARWLGELLAGTRLIFNTALPRSLLYRFEKPQFHEIWERSHQPNDDELFGKQIADIYGCEFLLRLMTLIPSYLSQAQLDEPDVTAVREEISKLAMWLARDKQIARYLSAGYENVTPEYVDAAREYAPVVDAPVSTSKPGVAAAAAASASTGPKTRGDGDNRRRARDRRGSAGS